MGAQVSTYPTIHCSAPGCTSKLCSNESLYPQICHLTKQEFAAFVHKSNPKARMCCICSIWYCSDHKDEFLLKRSKKFGNQGKKYNVYKCHACVSRLQKAPKQKKKASKRKSSRILSVASSIRSPSKVACVPCAA